MRAAYLVAPGHVELREERIPVPETGGAVVRVRVALTDGTDLKAFRRGHPQMPLPTRFGHEFSGDVAAIGAGVSAFAPGDPILSVHSAPCGACYWCLHAEEELCENVMATKILAPTRSTSRYRGTSWSVTRSTSRRLSATKRERFSSRWRASCTRCAS